MLVSTADGLRVPLRYLLLLVLPINSFVAFSIEVCIFKKQKIAVGF